MRGLIVIVALVLVLSGAGFIVWRMSPTMLAAPATAPAGAPVSAAQPEQQRAETCTTGDAIYAYRRDPTLTLRITEGSGAVRAFGSAASSFNNLGSLVFVVSKGAQEFRFAAASSQGVTLNYLFALRADNSTTIPAGVDLIQLSTFDSGLAYTPALPQLESAAPAHIYAPGLTRYLYTNSSPRIEAPVDFFDFQSCEAAPAASAASEATQPAQ